MLDFHMINLTAVLFQDAEHPIGLARLNTTILAAAISGAVTAMGWFVLKWLDVRAQARLKQADFRRSYIEKQIEQFYGPLYSLAWQIVTTSHLKDAMLRHRSLGKDDRLAIEDYFAKTYLLPIHSRVKSILESKLYLIDGTVVPDSFYEYLEASLQETVQRSLWEERAVSTSFMAGSPYPDDFQRTIYKTLKKLMAEYEVNVQELTGVRDAGKAVSLVPKKDGFRDDDPFKGDYVC